MSDFPGWLLGDTSLPDGRVIEHRLTDETTKTVQRRPGGSGSPIGDEQIAQMKALAAKGFTRRKIADMLLLNRCTVERHLNGKAELKRRPDPKWAQLMADLVASGLTMYKITQLVGATGGSGRAWAKGGRPTSKFRDKLISLHQEVTCRQNLKP